MSDRRIVCLIGSTRFYQQYQEMNFLFTMHGYIVLSVGFYPHAEHLIHHESLGITSEQKQQLDYLHLDKIKMSDLVYLINPGGYIGESTKNELQFAYGLGKPIAAMHTPMYKKEEIFKKYINASLDPYLPWTLEDFYDRQVKTP